MAAPRGGLFFFFFLKLKIQKQRECLFMPISVSNCVDEHHGAELDLARRAASPRGAFCTSVHTSRCVFVHLRVSRRLRSHRG